MKNILKQLKPPPCFQWTNSFLWLQESALDGILNCEPLDSVRSSVYRSLDRSRSLFIKWTSELIGRPRKTVSVRRDLQVFWKVHVRSIHWNLSLTFDLRLMKLNFWRIIYFLWRFYDEMVADNHFSGNKNNGTFFFRLYFRRKYKTQVI